VVRLRGSGMQRRESSVSCFNGDEGLLAAMLKKSEARACDSWVLCNGVEWLRKKKRETV